MVVAERSTELLSRSKGVKKDCFTDAGAGGESEMRANVDGGTRRDGSTKKEKGERNKNIEDEDWGGCRIRNTEGEEKDGE